MSKIQKSTREAKKQPALTLKEKRAKKHNKKHEEEVIQPFIPK